jgi:hypothetical protein
MLSEKMKDMNKTKISFIVLFMLVWMGSPKGIAGQWLVDIETGMVSTRYNDVRVPNEGGTLISLSDDLKTDPAAFIRLRLGYRLGKRHNLILLAAPLSLKAKGQVDTEVSFNGETFPAGTPLEGKYTFNSYRLTYRFDLKRSPKWIIGIGFTAKIRDAAIRVEGGGLNAETTNTGFVPLLNFFLRWSFAEKWHLLLEADALASPGGQGRAEDVLLGLAYSLSPRVDIKAGYRFVEGGADVDTVYNFAWINYFMVGTTIRF